MQRKYANIGGIYNKQGDYRQSLDYFFKAKTISEQLNNKSGLSYFLTGIGDDYYRLKKFDSARLYAQRAYDLAEGINYFRTMGVSWLLMGDIHSETGQNTPALEYYRLSIPYCKKAENDLQLSQTFLGIAKVFEKTRQNDPSLFYAKHAIIIAQEKNLQNSFLMPVASYLLFTRTGEILIVHSFMWKLLKQLTIHYSVNKKPGNSQVFPLMKN